MRLFIAIDLDDAARDTIAAEQKRLVSAIGKVGGSRLTIVRPEQMHLTLVFLGEVAEPIAAQLTEGIAAPVDQRAFDLTFAGIGVFPPRGSPNVLWVGVTEGAREVAGLQHELARRVGELGIPLETRPFHAHLTLARWRESRSADRSHALDAAARNVVARIRVDHATLYHSRLSPSGPTYTPLARATLTTT
jgi:2'-5' RNA ligase